MTNLLRAPSGTYFYRRVVPDRLRAALGKREIKISLHTKDVEEAKRRAPDAQKKVDAQFSQPNVMPAGVAAAAAHEPLPYRLTVAQIDEMARKWLAETLEISAFHNALCRFPPDQRSALVTSARETAREYRARAFVRDYPDHIIRLAHRVLAEAGFQIEENSLEFPLVCFTFMRAFADLQDAEAERLSGNTSYYPAGGMLLPVQPNPPPVLAAAIGVPVPTAQNNGSTERAPGETVTAVLDKWLRERSDMSATTIHECRTLIRRLTEVIGGDVPIERITAIQIRTLKEALIQMPVRIPTAVRQKPLLQIIEKFKDSTIQRVRPETVRKQMCLLQIFFEWAKNHHYVASNLAEGLMPAKSKHRGDRRRIQFSTEDMVKIFAAPIYTGCKSVSERLTPGDLIIKDEYFWLPLLAAFQGGRLEELGSLLLREVKSQEGALYLELDVIEQEQPEDDDSLDRKVAADYRMKTNTALRLSPVHPIILACGFEQYVRELRGRGETRLFPNLKPNRRGAVTQQFSKWFGRFLARLGITDTRKVFHSFRHGFKSACRRAGLPEEHHDALTGHWNKSVGRDYGEIVPITVLAEAVRKISYPGLDLSHLTRLSQPAEQPQPELEPA
ncbi:MAG TPA: site-specific integrase [Alphaproteobacteria bacterium]|nr:site-specific integrase [Alphaproteobacteria bacterium]